MTLRGLLLFFACSAGLSGLANHVLGGNVTFDCLGGNQYGITLTIYKDCFGATPATIDETLFFFPSGGTCSSFPFSADAPFVSEEEISDLCPSESQNSSCNGGLTPGTLLLTYYVVVPLNPSCSWSVEWSAGDWNYFVNLDTGALPNAYFRTTINPANGCDDSVEITSLQVHYYCVGQPVSQLITVDNPNGYTLAYSLTSVLTDFGLPAVYEPGYSAANPIPGLTLNGATGQIAFNAPFQFGNYVVAVEIDMFEGGVLVGSITETMAFVIQLCPFNATDFIPAGVSANSATSQLINATTVSVCAGQPVCFSVIADNNNNQRIIDLATDFLVQFPSGSFTQTGTNPAVGQVCVLTNQAMTGTYTIHFEATDDDCDSPGFDALDITLIIEENLAVSAPSATVCFGETASFTAAGAPLFSWNVVSGDTDPDFLCATCGNQSLTPETTTVVEVVAIGAPASCNFRDTITITVNLGQFTAALTNETCGLNNGAINLTVGGGGPFLYNWDIPFAAQDPSGLSGGTHCVTVTDVSLPGCSRDSCFTLTATLPPSGSISGNTTICQGQSADILFDLEGSGPFSVSMTPSGPAVATDNQVFTVTPAVTTTYVLNGITDSNIPSCIYSVPSSVTITVLPLVSGFFSGPSSVCEGEEVALALNLTQPGLFDVGYSINGIPQPQVTASTGTVLNFSPTVTTDFTLTSVQYAAGNTCPNLQSTTLTVVFNEDPDASLTGGGEICLGDNIDLTISLLGTGPWSVNYTVGGIAQPPMLIAATPFTWSLSPAVTTTYCLTGVTDLSSLCTHPVNVCQTVVVEPVLAVNFSGDPVICFGDAANLQLTLTSSPGLFNATLEVTDSGSSNEVVLTNLVSPYTYTVSPAENTSYKLVSVEYADNPGDCMVFPGLIVDVEIATEIQAEVIDTVCSPNGQQYQLIVELSGGNPAGYTAVAVGAAPGVFAGNLYTSGFIPSGTGAFWTFSDNNACNTVLITIDPYSCPIVTWSGTMQPDTLVLCGNAPVFAEFNNDAVFDGDDQQMFVLHTLPDAFLGTLIATDCGDNGFNDGDTPLVFGSGPGQLQYGTVYYISSVVGDDDGSGDCVNLLAPYVSVSFGQPVVWYDFPTATLAGGGSVCQGSTVSLQVDFSGQAPWSFAYAIDGAAQPPVTTFSDPYIFPTDFPGTYTLTAVATEGCGGATAGAADVEVFPLPFAEIQAGGETCEGTPFVFEVELTGASPWNYSISYIDGINPPAVTSYAGIVSSPAFFQGAAAGTYALVTVTDGNGCASSGGSLPVQLAVNPLPSASFAFPDTSFCENATLDLLVALTGESPWTVNYAVDGGAALQWNATSSPFTFTTAAGGLFEIVQVTDNNGCVSAAADAILITEIPTPQVDAGPDLTVCSGDGTLLGTQAVPGQSYAWSPSLGLSDSAVAQPVANIANTGVSVVSIPYAVTAALAQCQASDTLLLTVHFVPLADAGANDTLCFGDTLGLVATGGTTYLWQDNGFFLDPLSDPDPEVAPNTPGWFVVTVFDDLLCEAQDSVFIEVPGPLTAQEDFDAGLCFGVCDGSIDVVPAGGFGNYTISWSGASLTGFSVVNLCPGTYTYTITDDFGCIANGAVTLEELPFNAIDDVVINPPLCFGAFDGDLAIVETGAVSYTLVNTGEANDSGLFGSLSAGTYPLQVIDGDGCVTDTTVVLTELSPEITFDPAFEELQVCYLEVVDFNGEVSGGSGAIGVTWYDCPGLTAGCEVGVGIPLSLTIVESTLLYGVAVDENGCASNVVELAALFNSPINLNLDPSGQASVCEFGCINLEAGASGSNGPVGLTWFTVDGGISSILNESFTTELCPLTETLVYVTAEDGCSVPVTDSVLVSVFDTPDAQIGVSFSEGCYPLTLEFVNLTDETLASSCTWNMDDGNTVDICGGFQYTYADEGEYLPWISVTSPDGCTDLDTLDIPVVVHGYPTADFTWEPQPVTVVENTVNFIDQSDGAQSWSWDFSGYGSSIYPNPPFVFPDVDLAVYPVCLEVTNVFGCAHEVCKDIFMNSLLQVWVPNAFTPDNDGMNEFFLPVIKGADPDSYRLVIYDRGGTRVFETSDLAEGWIGDVRGGDHFARDGVYVWRIELRTLSDGAQQIFNGHVTLIR